MSQSKHIYWVLFTLSFWETIIIPIPIELVLIPLLVANRDRIWVIAGVALAGCLTASLLGYGVGKALYETAGTWFIETLGYEQEYDVYQDFFSRHGFWAILFVGVVPIPFQLAMITAGAANYPVLLFVAAAVIARGIRYYGLALLVKYYGDEAIKIWKQNAVLASIIAGAIVLVFYLLMRLLAGAVY